MAGFGDGSGGSEGGRARQALSSEGGGKAFGTVTEDEASPSLSIKP